MKISNSTKTASTTGKATDFTKNQPCRPFRSHLPALDKMDFEAEHKITIDNR
jgi:hypothetical protein